MKLIKTILPVVTLCVASPAFAVTACPDGGEVAVALRQHTSVVAKDFRLMYSYNFDEAATVEFESAKWSSYDIAHHLTCFYRFTSNNNNGMPAWGFLASYDLTPAPSLKGGWQQDDDLVDYTSYHCDAADPAQCTLG